MVSGSAELLMGVSWHAGEGGAGGLGTCESQEGCSGLFNWCMVVNTRRIMSHKCEFMCLLQRLLTSPGLERHSLPEHLLRPSLHFLIPAEATQPPLVPELANTIEEQ